MEQIQPNQEIKTPIFSLQDISIHNNEQSCWIAIDNLVYDVTKFLDFHPAGKNIILEYAGQDASNVFSLFHRKIILKKYERFIIGKLDNQKIEKIPPILSYQNAYGEGVPYGDQYSIQGWKSPYYTENHHKLRKAIRSFLEAEIMPNLDQWDENNEFPRWALKKIADNGIYALICGKPWPKEFYPEQKVCGVEIKNLDMFHENIFYEEINRFGSGGLMWSIVVQGIGLPPILRFASEQLKQKYAKQCLTGEKQIILAITEPWGGSDVANLRTTATKTPCGKYYIVNGMKKYISRGYYADCYTIAVRTGGPGMQGVSLLVMDSDSPGIRVRNMKTTGVWVSSLSFMIFENVKVPVENLIGEENQGFKYTMYNFNHERLQITVQAVTMARSAYEESMKYANKRETFGKKLIEHPVIRNKLAHMVRQIESTQAYIDICTYNYEKMPQFQKIQQLSGAIAILKCQATTTLQYCVCESVQIFGGNAYQRGGIGSKIERLYREFKGASIGGGAEEVMLDLGMRQAQQLMPRF